jgi:hypothetical protein
MKLNKKKVAIVAGGIFTLGVGCFMTKKILSLKEEVKTLRKENTFLSKENARMAYHLGKKSIRR